EAIAAATGLIDAAEATRNPFVLTFALQAYGFAFRDADPARARDALRRGLVIAQGSGNRLNETYMAQVLARLEADHGDPLAALDYTAVAVRHHHDSGNTIQVGDVLAVLAGLFDNLGRHEAAATMAGFAVNPSTVA